MTDRETALRAEHERLGARMTSFAGWRMPLHYGSQLGEHRAVRENAGLFDLSHMGTVWVSGPEAGAFLDYAVVGGISGMEVGQAKYTLLCTPEGGIVDDLIVYRVGEDRFLTVPNAANTAAVIGELVERSAGFTTEITDSTSATALLAVQGPRAVEIVGALATEPVEDIGYYRARWTTLGGLHVLLARTGYTGEDGFEVFLPGKHASGLWHELVATAPDLVPAGLAARDSLRLEAAMPLYGNELSRDVDPFTVGLGGIVGLKRKTADFVGREALERIRAAHLAREPGRRVLVGLVGDGRRAARQGDAVLLDGQEVGRVTSGLPSPTLGRPIALAIVDPAAAEVGTGVEADVRGRREPFTVVERPFYRRPEPH